MTEFLWQGVITELLYVSLASVIVILTFIVYPSSAPRAVKLAVFPALIAVIIFGYMIFQDSMGAPINRVPQGVFTYVHHQAGNGGEVIYVWIWSADRGQRLHIIPYDRETMEQLEEARGRAEQGQEYGRFTNNNGGFEYEQAGEPYETEEGFTK